MKKILAVLLIVLSLGITGCQYELYEGRLPEYESGYFRYAVRTMDDGTQKAYLMGLTDSGMAQSELIYPQEIEEIPVYGIGYEREVFMGLENVRGVFESENLKKFYFPTTPKEKPVGWIACDHIVQWDLSETNYICFGDGAIFGYNYLKAGLLYQNYQPRKLANVSYLYNYEGGPNMGYYWVDSYDESTISFVPPAPNREGYTFGGWYKEESCENKWDFEKDITGKEIDLTNRAFSEKEEYSITNLYAKWISI